MADPVPTLFPTTSLTSANIASIIISPNMTGYGIVNGIQKSETSLLNEKYELEISLKC